MPRIFTVLALLLLAVMSSGCARVKEFVGDLYATAVAPPAPVVIVMTPRPTATVSLALAVPVSNPQRVITVGPSPTRPSAASAGGQGSPTPLPPTAAVTPTPTPTPNAIAVVQAQTLNVRGGPGKDRPLVAVLQQDQQVDVVGRNVEATWFELKLAGDKTGWVAGEFVSLYPAGATPGPQARSRPPAASPAQPPTAPPAATAALAAPARPLEVSFINPHYECENRVYPSSPLSGSPAQVYSRRSFQIDLYIRNNGGQPVEPPWRPARWIITDGSREFATSVSGEWPDHNLAPYSQPTIHPGQIAGWTFRTVELSEGQWVRAVEFEWNGQTYRQALDLGPYGQAYNYRGCDR